MLAQMSPPPLIVIFGAALRPDGSPSQALARRIACGLAAARGHPQAPVLCSGGAGPSGMSEASVIARALAAEGIAPDRLILDEASATTRQNVEAAARAAVAGGHPHVIVCSDAYHRPRIAMLLRLAGVAARPGPSAASPPLAHHLAMTLREAAALVHNLGAVAARGSSRTSRAPAKPR